MSLSAQDINKIASLANLQIDAQNCRHYSKQLNRIFELVEQMSQVDTTDIEPMAHPQDMALRLREDRVTEKNNRELLQSLAPVSEEGLYLVPRVID